MIDLDLLNIGVDAAGIVLNKTRDHEFIGGA